MGDDFVSIGKGEKAPWADLDLTCPACGAECELQQSDPPGLTYITHCGKSYLRGDPDFNAMFAHGTESVSHEPRGCNAFCKGDHHHLLGDDWLGTESGHGGQDG